MTKKQAIKLFEEKKIRSVWDDEQEKWYFSIVDVVSILTDSVNPQSYWRKLKQRLIEEGNETVTNCHALTSRIGYLLAPFRQLQSETKLKRYL